MAVNLLLSFAFFARDNLADYRAKMPCGRLMIDSGAYTAFSKGTPIHLNAYAEFLEHWAGAFDHAVTLDVIGDPVATAANTRKLHNRGIPVMPVFTRGGSVAEFTAMVKDCGYVCVGGGVGMPPKLVVNRLAALQRHAEDHGGGIHALGVGNLAGIRQIRPYSCDASNVSSAFRFGTLICYDGRRLVTISPAQRAKVRANLRHLRDQGVPMAELVASGRQPTGKARDLLMRGLSVAYMCADEDTAKAGVPVPHGTRDTPGTHLYSAVTGAHLAVPVAELDGLAHSGTWTVPMWERAINKHQRQCRAVTRQQEATA